MTPESSFTSLQTLCYKKVSLLLKAQSGSHDTRLNMVRNDFSFLYLLTEGPTFADNVSLNSENMTDKFELPSLDKARFGNQFNLDMVELGSRLIFLR